MTSPNTTDISLTFPRVLYVQDAWRGLTSAEQDSVDVVITDPPYNSHVQGNLRSGSIVGTKSVPKYDLDFNPLNEEQMHWLNHATRMARRWVVSFCALEDFGRFQDNMQDRQEYVRGGVWYKPNAMGQLTKDRPATSFEGVAILHNTRIKKRWNGRGSYGIWKCNGTRGKKGRHLNEKPLDLCLKLVALFSERGEIVFDPFCGSGAIGEACVRLGRGYIGLDKNTQWTDTARARCERAWHEVQQDPSKGMTDEVALSLCRMNDLSKLEQGGG